MRLGDPGGAMGVVVKMKFPKSMDFADMFGFSVDGRKRLSVMRSCESNEDQRCIGKSFGREHKPEIKWFLNV